MRVLRHQRNLHLLFVLAFTGLEHFLSLLNDIVIVIITSLLAVLITLLKLCLLKSMDYGEYSIQYSLIPKYFMVLSVLIII